MTKDDLLLVLLIAPFILGIIDQEVTIWCTNMSVLFVCGGCIIGAISFVLFCSISHLMGIPGSFTVGTSIGLTFGMGLRGIEYIGLQNDPKGVALFALVLITSTLTIVRLYTSYDSYMKKRERFPK